MVSQASWLFLIGLVSFTATTELTKTKQNATLQESFLDRCTPVPTWTVGGERVLRLVGQNITVIALLNSSRPFGRQQAGLLHLLRGRLYNAGFPAINFMVINSKLATGNTELLQHEAASIPVYQEQPGEPVREILGAGNDQILVLDRCGRIAYQAIAPPFSKLTNPYVKAAILTTYKDNPCGFCNITRGVGEIDTNDDTLGYASDAPSHAKCKLELCHDSASDLSVSPEQEDSHEGNQTAITKTIQSYAETRNRENGLTQSFLQPTDIQEPLEIAKAHETASLGTSTENVFSAYKENFTGRAESVNSSLLAVGQQRSTLYESRMQESHDNTVPLVGRQGNLSHMANWDWSENQNNGSDIGASGESTEQSVEVVFQVQPPKRKKKRRKSKHRGTPCEGSNDSNEKLVKQAQLLLDFYNRLKENSEEKAKRPDILRQLIIDDWRKAWHNRTYPGPKVGD